MEKLKVFALDFSPAQVEAKSRAVMESCDTLIAPMLARPVASQSFAQSFIPYHQSEGVAATWACQLVLASMVHTDRDIRQACTEWKGKFKVWLDGRYASCEIQRRLESARALESSNDLRRQELMRDTLRAFKANGVELNGKELDKLLKAKAEIGSLEFEFQRNLGEDVSFCAYSSEELRGCSAAFIDGLDVDSKTGKFLVTTKPPHVRAIMETCAVEETRKRHSILSQSRCMDVNASILSRLVKARSEAASVLGYDNWCDYKLGNHTMAGGVENVWKMIDSLFEPLNKASSQDIAKLAALKAKDVGLDVPFQSWDFSFYEKILMKQVLGIDNNELKKYFPLDFCVRRVMDIYEYLFGIKFQDIEDSSNIKWHPDVLVFAVSDASSPSLLGHLYLDLFSRPGKYAHQCVIPLAPCYLDPVTGARQLPVIANISNLSARSERSHALLAHGELITFFHEFGHAVHALVTSTDYTIHSWSWNAVPYQAGVEIDFLEVPSKGFEFFAWRRDVLERVTIDSDKVDAAHVQKMNGSLKTDGLVDKSPYPLPADVIKKLRDSQYQLAGYSYMRMAFMTAFDLLIHSIPFDGPMKLSDTARKLLPESITSRKWILTDVTEQVMLNWYRDLQLHFTGMKSSIEIADKTNPLASWYHMAMGYDAGYYGYLWSETVAADIFMTLFDGSVDGGAGCLNQANGLKLRKYLLSKGASEPATLQLEHLLGRDMDPTALLKAIFDKNKT